MVKNKSTQDHYDNYMNVLNDKKRIFDSYILGNNKISASESGKEKSNQKPPQKIKRKRSVPNIGAVPPVRSKSAPMSKMSKRQRRLLSKIRSYLLPRSFEFHPCCEKNARAASFPPLALKTSSSSLDHRSMFADFTCEMCTPNDLCMPEQSRHMNTQ